MTGKYKRNKENPAYKKWCRIKNRCNSNEKLAYKEASLCSDWNSFERFSDWFYSQKDFNKDYHIDKDLLKLGNKIYSPETCLLIPQWLNSTISNTSQNRNGLPVGVSKSSHGKYRSELSFCGSKKVIGYFDTVQAAFSAYITSKKILTIEKAKKEKLGRNIVIAIQNYYNDLHDGEVICS